MLNLIAGILSFRIPRTGTPMVKQTLLPLLLLAAHLLSPALAAGLPSVALYYAQPPLAELRAFDVAVVDPDSCHRPRPAPPSRQ